MSEKNKTGIAIAVVIVLLAGGFLYWKYVQAPTVENPNEVMTLPTGNDTSDAALDQDFAAIDAQLDGVASDSASVSASVNDAAL